MSNILFSEDKQISFSRWLKSALKIQVLNDDETILDEIVSFSDVGDLETNASSYVRRNFSFSFNPEKNVNIGEYSRAWINKQIKVSLGLKIPRMPDFKWYDFGVFIFTDSSSNYNKEENTVSINCSDRMSQLDGTINGELGAIKTTIKAYDEDSTGTPTVYYTIREAIISTLEDLANVKLYYVDDIGEYNGTIYADNYKTYRENHPDWNYVPYDLEYSASSHASDILTDIIELYPNYDMAFNESGVLEIKMVPHCKNDSIVLSNDEIQENFISESCDTPLSSVRNIVHVWGKVFDVELYDDSATNVNSVYNATVTNTYEYANDDLIAIKVPSTNSTNQQIKVNSLNAYPIYDNDTDTNLSANTLTANTTYVFRYSREKFYLQGQWQAHALSVLVDGTVSSDNYTCSDGTITTKYSRKYFQDIYAVDTVNLNTIDNSPYTVQKIGERLSTKSDGEYANITSDYLAQIRSDYELFNLSRLTDNVTVTIKGLTPWLKEYMKVSYIKKNETELKEYITDTVSMRLSDGTTTISMHTFYES